MTSRIEIEWDDPDELELASQKGATLMAKVKINGRAYGMTFVAYQMMEHSISHSRKFGSPYCPTLQWNNPVLVPDVTMEHILAAVEYLVKYNLVPDSWSLE